MSPPLVEFKFFSKKRGILLIFQKCHKVCENYSKFVRIKSTVFEGI